MTQLCRRRSPKSEKIAIRFDAIRHAARDSLPRSLLANEPLGFSLFFPLLFMRADDRANILIFA
jgi:hypothetical protein